MATERSSILHVSEVSTKSHPTTLICSSTATVFLHTSAALSGKGLQCRVRRIGQQVIQIVQHLPIILHCNCLLRDMVSAITTVMQAGKA